MIGVILAAGEGMRMRPLTERVPKPMLRVARKPLLVHIVNALPPEVDELIMVVGYLGHVIRGHFGERFGGRRIRYVVQDGKRGTYRALALCRPFLRKGERFLLVYADDLLDAGDLARLVAARSPCLMVSRVADPSRFGVVHVDAGGRITAIEEKPRRPTSDLVSVGAKLLDPDIFRYPARRAPNGEYYLTDSLARMLSAGRSIHTLRATWWCPVGYPRDIARAEKALAHRGR